MDAVHYRPPQPLGENTASLLLARMHLSHPAGCDATVYRHRRASHERSIRGAQEEADPRDFFGLSHSS